MIAEKENSSYIGSAWPGIDTRGKVTKATRYPSDQIQSGVLWRKPLRASRAHARIIKIDTGQAEDLPGVRALLHNNSGREKEVSKL